VRREFGVTMSTLYMHFWLHEVKSLGRGRRGSVTTVDVLRRWIASRSNTP
jgi:hypothetical protein